jgi:hypothetical protein
VGDEDDDGNEAAAKPPQKAPKAVKPDPEVLDLIKAVDNITDLQALYKGLSEGQRTACLDAFAARRKELDA